MLNRLKKRKRPRVKTKVDRSIILRRLRLALQTFIIVFLISIGFFSLIKFLLFSNYFKITEVTVIGANEFVNEADVLSVAYSFSTGKNIFLFKPEELNQNLRDNFLGAEEIEILKEYPRTLVVNVTERTPIAIVYNSDTSDEYFLIDKFGYVLGYTSPENSDLPLIRYEKEIKIGLFIDERVFPTYLEMTTALEKDNVKATSMSFFDTHVSLFVEDGINILISNEKSKQASIAAVKELLKQAAVENQAIQRIDLRYDKVIVLFR